MPRRSSSSADPPAIAEEAVAGAASSASAVEIIAGLADDVVPSLIRRLNQSGLGELEVRANGWRVRLRRPSPADGSPARASAVTSGAQLGGSAQPRRLERKELDQGAGATAGLERGLLTAPAVGYFVDRDGVAPGAVVRAGDAIGYIEVLGVREDVVASIDGSIDRFEVEPGQAVEYGQPIARLRPADS